MSELEYQNMADRMDKACRTFVNVAHFAGGLMAVGIVMLCLDYYSTSAVAIIGNTMIASGACILIMAAIRWEFDDPASQLMHRTKERFERSANDCDGMEYDSTTDYDSSAKSLSIHLRAKTNTTSV